MKNHTNQANYTEHENNEGLGFQTRAVHAGTGCYWVVIRLIKSLKKSNRI